MALADTSLLAELIGADELSRLVGVCGGLEIRIPKTPPIGVLSGLTDASQQALCHYYGGDVLYVPKCDGALRAARNEQIGQLYAAGYGVQRLARRFGLTERQIYNILGSPVPEDSPQGRLF